MGSIKDRNGMDLKEAEDFRKRCQQYTEELYKKDLNDPDNHAGVCVCMCVRVYTYVYMCIYTHTCI